jgi:hypothetical protein
MNVNFKAFDFVQSERALKLSNSDGDEQSRLHLYDFNGEEGKDRYAVAAKVLTVAKDETPALGWLDRKFYVLHAHKEGDTTTWYKINKNSLQKRILISPKEMKNHVDSKTGVMEGLEDLLNARVEKKEALKSKCITPLDPSSEKFLEKLAATNVPLTPFKHIAICNKPDTHIFANSNLYLGPDTDKDPNNIRHFAPDSILVVAPRAHKSHNTTNILTFIDAQQSDDLQKFLLYNPVMRLVSLPFSEDHYDEEMQSNHPIDPQTLERLDVQGALIRDLEEACKDTLWNLHRNPVQARIVLANGSNQVVADIPPEKENFPDLQALAKTLVPPDKQEDEPYFPRLSSAFCVARYDGDNSDKWLLLYLDLNIPNWTRQTDLLTNPKRYEQKHISSADITRIFADFK